MREVTIDAGSNEAALPNTKEKITHVFLKGVRRPFALTMLRNSDFDRIEKESYSNLMRGVPLYCTIRHEPTYCINIMPRPTGKVTILLEYPEEKIPDGLDTTWQRTLGPR